MSWLDWVVLVVVGFNAFQGLGRGFVRTAMALIGGLLGLFLAARFYATLAERLFSSESAGALIAAFALIFLAVMVLASLGGKLLQKAVSLIMLGWVDRLAGLVLGALLGAMGVGAALALLAKLGLMEGGIRDSRLAALLVDKFPLLLALLPGEFDFLKSFFQ